MLNIGPRANGEVPFEISRRLKEMGDWLAVNGESIYNSEAFDLRKDLHDWGRITYRRTASGKHLLFLHVFNWPIDKELTLTGIKTTPSKVYALADKLRTGIGFEHREVITSMKLPDLQPDPFISVIVVEYDEAPEIVTGLVARSVSGGFSLTPGNLIAATGNSTLTKAQRRGSIPAHVVVDDKSTYKWQLFIEESGTYNVDVSYSFQGRRDDGKILVKIAGTSLDHKLKPTGKTVGEPNSDWVIDSFNAVTVGHVSFESPGLYDIELEIHPAKKEAVKFQWMWVDLE